MFFARYKTPEGDEHAELYFSFPKYAADTFSPLTKVLSLVEFKIHGNDYASRKSSCESVAVEFSNCDTSGLYMSDFVYVGEWFSRNGKRYGLLKDFRENGLC